MLIIDGVVNNEYVIETPGTSRGKPVQLFKATSDNDMPYNNQKNWFHVMPFKNGALVQGTAKGKKRIPIKELHYNHAALLHHLNESRADEQGVFYQIDKIWCVEFEDGFEGYMKPPGKKKASTESSGSMAEPRHKYVKLESLAGGDRYVVGDTVQSRFTENGTPKWFRGQITEVLQKGTWFMVKYSDGEELEVRKSSIKVINGSPTDIED